MEETTYLHPLRNEYLATLGEKCIFEKYYQKWLIILSLMMLLLQLQ